MTWRNLSRMIGRLGVLLPALLLGACVSQVRLAPDAMGWQTAGSDASWRADPILVVAKLDTDAGALPARGLVVNTGRTPVRVTFVPDVAEAGSAGDGGEGLPDAIVAGGRFEVPAAFDAPPGSFDFALRADERWNGLPPEGATISWTIVVTTPSGEARCPFHFRVASASLSFSRDVEIAIVTVVTAAALVAAGYWAFYL